MYDTGEILYISMPKTGTTSSESLLTEYCGKLVVPKGMMHKHRPVRMAPYFVRERRLVVGTIRPPPEWYVSVWNHNRAAQIRLQRCWGNGDDSFYSVLYGFTHPKELKDYSGAHGSLYGPGNLKDWFRYCDTGMWSWQINWFYQSADRDWLVHKLINTRDLMPSWKVLLDRNIKYRQFNKSPTGFKPQWTGEMLEWIHQADGRLWDELYDNIEPVSPLFVELT